MADTRVRVRESAAPRRRAARAGALLVALAALLALAGLAAAEPAAFVFQPIAPRATATDWNGRFGVSAELHRALQRYERQPSAAGAIGVLKHFNEFYSMDSAKRADILGAADALFQSVDIMKYELVMQTRARLAPKGAVKARRVGSSGQREAAIIAWVKGGRQGAPPRMDPEKQFKSDDDVTVFVREELIERDPLAHERVNGAAAAAEYVRAVREFGYTGDFDPSKDAQTEFLSPTRAYAVIAAREQLAPDEMPTFMFEWVRANREKYNNRYAVEMLEVWGWEKGWLTGDDPLGTTRAIKDVAPRPEAPDVSSAAAYISDNYRQVYAVHHGKFVSECKYLVRMIDAWEAVYVAHKTPLPAEWAEYRRLARDVRTRPRSMDLPV